jgi:hypothetical protein
MYLTYALLLSIAPKVRTIKALEISYINERMASYEAAGNCLSKWRSS